MLDEYAEDFGTNLSGQFSDAQRSQLKGSPLPYQNFQNYAAPESNSSLPNQQAYQQPPYVPAPGYPPVYQPYPGYPPQYVAPQSAPVAPQPAARNNRLDTIFPEESKELNELLRSEERAGCLRNIVFALVALAIIAVSFWGSFLLGKKFFMPADLVSHKNELPSFLFKQTKSKLHTTLDSARKLTQQTDDLFRAVDISKELPANAVPPEIKNKPAFINGEALHEGATVYVPPVRTTPAKPVVSTVKKTMPSTYKEIAGSYETKQMADDAALNLRNDGFPNFIFVENGKYRIQIGAFKSKDRASQYVEQAKEYGYNPVIVAR